MKNRLEAVYTELSKLAIFDYSNFSKIKESETGAIYRFESSGFEHIIKYFDEKNHKEIANYLALKETNVELVPLHSYTPNAILLDDMDNDPYRRFATSADLEDEGYLEGIAKWYKKMHNAGYTYNNFDLKNLVVSVFTKDVTFIDLKNVEENNEFQADLKNISSFDKTIGDKVKKYYGGE